MKLSPAADNGFTWEMGENEYEVFLKLLNSYPSLVGSLKPLTADQGLHDSDQQLLEDALFEQRAANKAQLHELLQSVTPGLLNGGITVLKLKAGHLEPLLQAFNDVRVGAWTKLGSPDLEKAESLELTGDHFRSLWLMEMGGYFQSIILEAMEGEEG